MPGKLRVWEITYGNTQKVKATSQQEAIAIFNVRITLDQDTPKPKIFRIKVVR
jgi:hypothetical protein